ncbi:hypothetical protein ACFL7D_09795, partial [candidate division KSB1 bacterium]
FIFVFTFQKDNDLGIFTDVINADSGKHISSAYFPFIPKAIKNGYTYKTGKNTEGFYVIQKYRIHPAVYGK